MSPSDLVTAQSALILHRSHHTVDAIVRQLTQIGMSAERYWPELPHDLEPTRYALVFFDADTGHDEQFPWPAGEAPIPTIALIGSEAPGRIAWAIRHGTDAHLLKPVTGGGIYSAVLLARDAFARRQALRLELGAARSRLEKREVLTEATALLMHSEGLSPRDAFQQLRLRAMAQRLTIEVMAERIVARTQRRNDRA